MSCRAVLASGPRHGARVEQHGDWSHGFIIPLFSLYYLYMRRDRMPLEVSDWPVASRLAGAGLVVAGFASLPVQRVRSPRGLSPAAFAGADGHGRGADGLWLAHGRWSWFAVAFLIFAVPLPKALYVPDDHAPAFHRRQRLVGAAQFDSPPESQPQGALVEYMYLGRQGSLDIEQACSGIR